MLRLHRGARVVVESCNRAVRSTLPSPYISFPPGAALISDASQTYDTESPSLTVRAAELARDLRALAYDHVELVALEAQRAARGLATMLCAAVVISILCVTAWLALVAGAIVWATASGVSWASALAIAAVTNVIASGFLALWLRRRAGEIVFVASLRQLRGDAARAAGDGP